jgi:cell volume regulation protein A
VKRRPKLAANKRARFALLMFLSWQMLRILGSIGTDGSLLATGEPRIDPSSLIPDQLLQSGVPLPVLMVVIGSMFLITLAISRFSLKLGIPAILGVLIFGLLIDPGSSPFTHTTIEWIHTLSLSMLLFYAGLKTELRSIRGFLEYGVVLAVGGAIVSSLVLGLIIWFLGSSSGSTLAFGFNQIPLGVALLIAASLGSTDAGATIGVLNASGSLLPKRLQSLLEFEASVNDPAAILFLGLVVGLTTSGSGSHPDSILIDQIQFFVQKIGSGLLVGLVLSYLARFSLERLVHDQAQLLVLGVAIALLSYGVADLLGGSGFISAYVCGLFLANHKYRNFHINTHLLQQALLPFNSMTEIAVFLIFGVEMLPGKVLHVFPFGLVVALVLMLVARPVSVLLFQPLSPFNFKEGLLISWCGLRGAVPLALSFVVIDTIPKVRGIDPGSLKDLINNTEGIIFCVVMINLLIQGLSLRHLARWLGLKPDDHEEDLGMAPVGD